MRDRLDFEFKDASVTKRIIEGYASTADLDQGNDIVEPGACKFTDPSSVQVFVGHDWRLGALPVGVPLEIRQDPRGLFTRTKIHNTARGDELLEVARAQPLGISISYPPSTVKATFERKSGRLIRRISSLDLAEYSFTPIPMNDHARVTAVKSKYTSEWAALEVKSIAEALSETLDRIDPVEMKAGARMRRPMRELLDDIADRVQQLRAWAQYEDQAATSEPKSLTDKLLELESLERDVLHRRAGALS